MASLITDFTYKKTLTFDTRTSGGIDVTSNLSNFPICVHLNTNSWGTQSERDDFFDNAGAAGDRVQFFDSDETTNLDYEIEYFDNTQSAEEAIYWIRVPQVDGNSNADNVVVAYGNDPNSADQSNSTGVWDASFKGIFHLKDSSGTTVVDSTGNQNGTKGSSGAPAAAACLVGDGNDWDGVDDYVDLPNSYFDNMTALTLETILKPQNMGARDGIINASDSGTTANISLELKSTSGDIYWIVSNTLGTTSTGVVTNNVITYVAATFAASSAMRVIKDAGSVVLNKTSGVPASSGTMGANGTASIGAQDGSGAPPARVRYWDGLIDEVRVSNVVRSDDWLKLTHYSMLKTNWNGDSWLTWGSQESTGGAPAAIASRRLLIGTGR